MTTLPQQLAAKPERTQSPMVKTLVRMLRDPRGALSISVLLLMLLAGVFAHVLSGDPTAQSAGTKLLPPSREHLFGVDELQRDLLARTLFGLRSSLAMAYLAVPVGAAAGASFGFTVGYAGRWIDATAMRFVDSMLAFPGLLLALGILTVLGPGVVNVGIAIAFLDFSIFARMARGQMLSERTAEYVMAARTLGARPVRIIFRHIAINALPPLLTQLSLAMAAAVLLEASLSFLGLGDKPPAASLGGLINASRSYLRIAWWYPLFPGMMLAALLLSLNFLADVFNEATNPWARRG
ncbi:MAG: ABC transporter permease [Dehalococcoidia bacterium]|nr:MAG: ABC transporter permease [Dehalococcoidia bacterium]